MLAQRMPGILPRLRPAEAVEVALIRSNAGIGEEISAVPPIRSPHHTATRAALVGGGSGLPTPGEISLAHRGVLFLDELAEFPRSHLDALRQPLEEGRVVISRQGATVSFPASFQLVAATNPCPCGYWGDRRRPCSCPPAMRERYRTRVSGPLLDRFDLSVGVRALSPAEYGSKRAESSAVVAARVSSARGIQRDRGRLNRDQAEVTIDASARAFVVEAIDRGAITARGASKVQRVARTIADLAAERRVQEEHVAEALALRGGW